MSTYPGSAYRVFTRARKPCIVPHGKGRIGVVDGGCTAINNPRRLLVKTVLHREGY
jgi:hypothetical protein